MASELQTAFNEISQMRALPQDVILDALQSALVSAYRRDSGASSAQAVEARIDPRTGQATIYVEKEVVDDIFSAATEVILSEARETDPECELGDVVMIPVEHKTKQFGRIAAQTAKQVILQKIREAERDALYEEFIDREGDLITGTVQSMNSSVVTLSLGRAEAILPRAHQIPGERYRQHEKLRVYVSEVKKSNRGPQIVVSRGHRNMLRRLLEYEVPEIYNGQVEIKSIAREAGYRSKVAVAALQEGIDPVGACVGMRGIRIQNIVKELHDEKIDVIEWNPDPHGFIAKALSPAQVTGVYLEDDIYAGRTAVVIVPDSQLSLAIGREGQNARLAAKLTGWRIDIKSETETIVGALENLDVPPLSELAEPHALLIEDARRIMEKKNANLTVMPEEYDKLSRFANIVETRLLQERDEIRQAKLAEIEAVKATLPQTMFKIPIESLELDEEIKAALQILGNVGEIMLAALINEDRVRRLLSDIPNRPMQQVQTVLDELVMLEPEQIQSIIEAASPDKPEPVVIEEAEVADVEAEQEVVAEAQAEAEIEAVESVAEEVPVSQEVEAEEVMVDAFGGEVIVEPEPEPIVEPEAVVEEEVVNPVLPVDFVEQFDDALDEMDAGKSSKKKSKQKRRQLVFDEESGKTIAKRRRKSSRKRESWEDDLDY